MSSALHIEICGAVGQNKVIAVKNAPAAISKRIHNEAIPLKIHFFDGGLSMSLSSSVSPVDLPR